jgi:hypothetical protein
MAGNGASERGASRVSSLCVARHMFCVPSSRRSKLAGVLVSVLQCGIVILSKHSGLRNDDLRD